MAKDKPSLTEQFDAALAMVTQTRGEDYGHPADDFFRASGIIDCLGACPNVVVRHALTMIAVKMARLVHNPEHLDSWVDIAGYARCAVMCLDMDQAAKDAFKGKNNA